MADFEIDTNKTTQDIGSGMLFDQGRETKGLSVHQFESMLMEVRNQPNWRASADKEADYYDGNQLDIETLRLLEERNLAPLITNLIKPTIDVVLGMEAKTRTDWKVTPSALVKTGASQDVSLALSAKLHEAEAEARADRACSDAYAGQAKVGMGWVEVAKGDNPFESQYRVGSVHRREMWWDWRAKQPDLSDARYMLRRQWLDEDVVMTAFPEHKSVIKYLMGGVPSNDLLMAFDNGLARAIEVFRGSSIEQYEYVNSARKRLCVYEIWYKQMVRGHVMRLPSGKVVEFDQNNQRHMEVCLTGMLDVMPATMMKMRRAYYIGSYCLHDGATPYRHHKYPYVPFFGFREDRTGSPYGLARAMMSPQDEINSRKIKAHWLLGSRRVIADSDAVLDHNAAAEEVARPDAYIQLNANRRAGSTFKVEDGGEMAAQQFQIMMESKQEINQAAGIYQSMMGSTGGGATSGLAINSLVEQGSTTLAELNDNYRYSRRLVGELLLELVKEDLEGVQTSVAIEEGDKVREILLNVPGIDANGEKVLLNDVSKANVIVALEDTPSSPSFRMQMSAQITEVMKSLPPEMQAAIAPFWLNSMDMPERKEMVKAVKKSMGIDTGDEENPIDPQVQAAMDQMQEAVAQLQAKIEEDAKHIEQLESQVKNKDAETGVKASMAENAKESTALQARIDAERVALDREQMELEAETKRLELEVQRAKDAADLRRAELAFLEKQESERIRAELDRRSQEAVAQAEIEKAKIEAASREREAELAAKAEANRISEEAKAEKKETKELEEKPPVFDQAAMVAQITQAIAPLQEAISNIKTTKTYKAEKAKDGSMTVKVESDVQ